MKRKEINEYAQSIVVKLYELGFFASIQESISTNSFYIHITQTSNVIRLSDHGFNFEMYNFLPRQKNVRSFNGGKYFYSMSYEGINAFLDDFKYDNQKNENNIKKCNEEIISNSKKYVLCHIPTNYYFCENGSNYSTSLSRILEISEKYSEMSDELKHILKLNFRPKLVSAQIFKKCLKIDIKDIIFDYDNIENYKFVEVDVYMVENGKKCVTIKNY